MAFLLFGLSHVADFFNHPITPKIVVSWIFLFLLYEIIMLMVIGSIIKQQKSQSTRLKIFNIIVETIFPGILLFLLCLIEETPKFLDSPLFLFYFIIIILSSLQLEVKMALLTCFLSALSYLGVTIWAINSFDPNFDTMHLHPFLYEIRSAFILMGGLCAVFVTSEIKKRNVRVTQLWKEKIEIESLFGQQVSPQVVESLVKDHSSSLNTEVSILFLDIRNFSSFIELKDPQEVNDFQNSLFCPLIEIINNHSGIVNQILGDGFMATFGAPVKDQNHISQAVNAGMEMLEKIENLIYQDIIPSTKVGIGVHTGKVVTGNIGNEIRKQYSVSGTTVVIAARLEQLNKQLNTKFLVSQKVYDEVKDQDCSFTMFKGIHLKGIEKPICVYEVSKNINEQSIKK
jgi:adenylate cyclase